MTDPEQARRERHMTRALALAAAPPHRTSPNPTVGCVIVRDGQTVGEGVSQPAGQAHAEVMALRQAGERARGAEVFVTLEPCAHTGRTPPCTAALIAAGVARVHCGAVDPNPLVHGKGIAQLRAAGITVETGLLADACTRQLAPFFRFITDRRPWVLLKAAVTLDGRIATAGGDSKWITGPAARRDAHQLRAWSDAVLVGAATVTADDPRLTVRDAPGQDPLRLVADPRAETRPDAALIQVPGALICHASAADPARLAALQAAGAETLPISAQADGRLDLAALLTSLATRGIQKLMVEGGGRLHAAFIAARLADEACLYIAPTFIGRGRPVFDLPSAPTITVGWRLDPVEITPLQDDVRIRGPIRYPAAPPAPDPAPGG